MTHIPYNADAPMLELFHLFYETVFNSEDSNYASFWTAHVCNWLPCEGLNELTMGLSSDLWILSQLLDGRQFS